MAARRTEEPPQVLKASGRDCHLVAIQIFKRNIIVGAQHAEPLLKLIFDDQKTTPSL